MDQFMAGIVGLGIASGLVLLGMAIGCMITFVVMAWQMTKMSEAFTHMVGRVSDLVESVDDRLLNDMLKQGDDEENDSDDDYHQWN